MADQLDRIGQKIGDYQLQQSLGHGTYGTVYLAKHLYDHSLVAMKVLRFQLAEQENFRSFLNEARTIRLQHPHIAPILDFGLSPDNFPFLVMSYADGGTVRDCYPEGTKLPWAAIDSYVQAIAAALQYAHDRRIIHRDVKPENMLVHSSGLVQLSDFGIAKLVEPNSASETYKLIGTPAYMAPEQIQGQACQASDQYALASIVYEWFAGQRLFTGGPLEVLVQHRLDAPPLLRTHCPEVSEEVEQVLLTALSKEPEARFPSIEMFAQELHGALSAGPQGEGVSVSSATPAGNYATIPITPPGLPAVQHHTPEEVTITIAPVEEARHDSESVAHIPADTTPSSPLALNERASAVKGSGSSVPGRRARNITLVALVFLLLMGLATLLLAPLGGRFMSLTSLTYHPKPTATLTPQAIYQRYTSGPPAQTDTRLDGTVWPWFNATPAYGRCAFSQAGYSVIPAGNNSFAACIASNRQFTQYAYQVQVTIRSGDAAGLIINYQPTFPFRTFDILIFCRDRGPHGCTPGNVWFTHASAGGAACEASIDCDLTYPFINTALGAQNTLTVIALNKKIYLYINGRSVGVVPRSSSMQGGIGLSAYSDATRTQAIFHDAKLWLLHES